MKHLHGFTLVEMIIVIVIISIMLSITLNMSANQTQSLRFKIARESFLANYNSFIIRAITTNSNDLRLELKIDNGAQIFAPINPVGSAASINFEDMSSLKLTDIDGNSNPGTIKTISFSPSLGQCLIDGNPTGVSGPDIVIGIGDRRSTTVSAECYTISLSTCKIKQGC